MKISMSENFNSNILSYLKDELIYSQSKTIECYRVFAQIKSPLYDEKKHSIPKERRLELIDKEISIRKVEIYTLNKLIKNSFRSKKDLLSFIDTNILGAKETISQIESYKKILENSNNGNDTMAKLIDSESDRSVEIFVYYKVKEQIGKM